jgi:16S rRNA G966 N2-methylase RsmD
LAPRGEVVLADVFHFLETRATEPFDYVYVAPPQYRGLWEKALQTIDAEPGWVAEDGLVIAQVFPKEHRALPLSHLHLERERRYGSTLLAFFQRTPSEVSR